MAGIFAQLGFANETITPPVSTAGTSAAQSLAASPFINTLTFGSAHGLSVGDVITLSGYTAAGWNGTFDVYTVPDATHLTFISPATLGALSVHGTISANHYGSTISGTTITPAPGRWSNFVSEGMELNNGVIDSVGIGGNPLFQDPTRTVNDRQGAGGPLKIELESKGFGFWLKHLFGPVVTTGPADSAFTHTGSPPVYPVRMLGNSFNMQGTVVPSGGVNSELVKTYPGCKVVSWQLDFAVGALASITVTIDAQDETYVITKSTASFPSTPEPLSFAGGVVQIGAVTWDTVKSGSIKCDMGYDAERRFVRSNTLQREPAQNAKRVITVELEGEFDNVLTVYNKVATSVMSQRMASISLAFTGKILIGVSTFPSLTLTGSVSRFGGTTPKTDGPGIPKQNLVAMIMQPGLTAAYVTTDSTP